ncbi:MAG TPA: nitroreductase family protein [Acidimicrobiia bacterium]|jgi:nitroreductase|nr:nitroreductase family protein [Acidimicrobiia bacterium]
MVDAMEFGDLIRKRRMVRNYTSEPVDGAVLERIASSMLRIPSAGFTQGVAVVVVTDQERRARIADLAGEEHYTASGFEPWISKAPAHIAICVSEADYRRRYAEPDKGSVSEADQDWPVPYWWVDGGAAMMLGLLAAVDEGLVAGFLGVHSVAGLAEALGLPDGVSPIGVMTVGHPAPDRPSTSLARGRRQDRIHWERWAE